MIAPCGFCRKRLRSPAPYPPWRALQRTLGTLTPVRIQVTDDSVEVLLSRWQKILGLLGDIRVPRADVSNVQVVEDPVREAMGIGIKVGLRLPWFYYVARTINLDQAFIVRRGIPGLSFAVHNQRLTRVLVSTPRARELAEQLEPS
jgi:hypothetical protein